MSTFERLAEERPRVYGAFVSLVGVGVLAFLRAYADTMGGISIALLLLGPLMLVYGVQAMVFATTPSSLKKDRVTMTVLLLLSAGGSFLLWQWLHHRV